MPPLARSRAACMPPMPPPTTSAAPTGGFWVGSDDMADGLLGGRHSHGPLLDRLEVQGEGTIDHVRRLAEGHLYHQHRGGDDHVQGIRVDGAQPEAGIPEDVGSDSGARGQHKQDREDHIFGARFLVDFLLRFYPSYKDVADAI